MTQSYETEYRNFWTNKILTKKDSIENYREATAEEKQQWEVAHPEGSTPAGRTAMTPVYEAAGVKFNDSTGFYELNGHTDIGEAEMATIYRYRQVPTALRSLDGLNVRTNLWQGNLLEEFDRTPNMSQVFRSGYLKTVRISNSAEPYGLRPSSVYAMFCRCTALETIQGVLNLSAVTSAAQLFENSQGYPRLRDFRIYGLKHDLNLGHCPAVSLESLMYILRYAANGSTLISIAVHSEVWAKMTAADVPVPGTDSLDWSNYQPNLLRDSERTVTNNKYPTATYNLAAIAPKAGETVTVMLNGELGEGKTSFDWYNSGGLVPLGALGKPTDGRILLTKAWRTSSGSQSASNTYVNFYALPANVVVDSTISHVKLALGSHTDMEWTMCSDDIEDPDLRERTKWRELPALAAARNISFVTN